jgi:hypothetical protein
MKDRQMAFDLAIFPNYRGFESASAFFKCGY